MELKTMSEWNNLGRYVNKGSKASRFVNAIPLFHISQTHVAKVKVTKSKYDYLSNADIDGGESDYYFMTPLG